MSLLFWIIILVVSLAVLVKAADFFTDASEKVGLFFKISPFIIGVTIVSMGTSLPELVTAIVSAFRGVGEIGVANAVGSNVANILLIAGVAAIAAKVLKIDRSLIDLDAPLLACVTAIFIAVIWDRQIVFWEALLLVVTYIIYLAYTISVREDKFDLPSFKKRKLGKWTIPTLIISGFFIYLGSDFTVRSIISIAELLNIATSVITMSVVALGTSLPELVVSVRAALKGKSAIALGNIFGSNTFNALLICGIPALFTNLTVDTLTATTGIMFLVIATILFIFSGISQKIHKWEGAMYLIIYVLFMAKLFGVF